jgi:hypothetical protein
MRRSRAPWHPWWGPSAATAVPRSSVAEQRRASAGDASQRLTTNHWSQLRDEAEARPSDAGRTWPAWMAQPSRALAGRRGSPGLGHSWARCPVAVEQPDEGRRAYQRGDEPRRDLGGRRRRNVQLKGASK